MNPALTIAFKDLRLMARDRPGMVFTLLFPLLFGLFFGAIYADTAGGDQVTISLAVVDQTDPASSASEPLILSLQDDPRITITPHESLESAATSEAPHSAVLVVPADFNLWFDTFGNSDRGKPVLYFKQTTGAEAGFVQGITSAALYRAVAQSLGDPDTAERRRVLLLQLADTEGADQLRLRAAANALQAFTAGEPAKSSSAQLDIETAPLESVAGTPTADRATPQNSFAITFPQAIMWAILGCVATFAVGLVTERNAGTLTRLRTMPITPLQILGGKGIACVTVSMTVSLAFVVLGRLIFDVKPVSYSVLFVALLCVSFAFAGIMMLLAVLGRSKTSPGQLAWGVILIMAITGGGMLPLFFMPEWLRSISHLSPVKWGIYAIEAGVWRGGSMLDMLGPFALLLGIGVVGFFIGARSFVLSERMQGQ